MILLWKIKENSAIKTDDLKYYFNDSVNSVLRQQNEELAKTYVEEQRLVSRIEMHLKEGSFNFAEFSDSVGQRALALAIKKAEEAVVLAESDLCRTKQSISNAQLRLNDHVASGIASMVNGDKEALRELNKQEEITKKRVAEAHEYLNELVSLVKSQTSQSSPKS